METRAEEENQTALPEEIWVKNILPCLDMGSLKKVSLSCRFFQRLSNDKALLPKPNLYPNAYMLALSDDKVVFVAEGGFLCVLNTQSGRFKLLPALNRTITGLARYSDDQVVIVTPDHMYLWNVVENRRERTWRLKSTNGKVIVTKEGKIIRTQQDLLLVLGYPNKSCSFLDFSSPDFCADKSGDIITITPNGEIKRYHNNKTNWCVPNSSSLDYKYKHYHLLPDDKLLMWNDSALQIFDLKDWRTIHTLKCKLPYDSDLHVVGAQHAVVIKSYTDTIRKKISILNIYTGECIKILHDHLRALTVMPDGRIITIGGESGNAMRIWPSPLAKKEEAEMREIMRPH